MCPSRVSYLHQHPQCMRKPFHLFLHSTPGGRKGKTSLANEPWTDCVYNRIKRFTGRGGGTPRSAILLMPRSQKRTRTTSESYLEASENQQELAAQNFGQPCQPGALALWTHFMKQYAYFSCGRHSNKTAPSKPAQHKKSLKQCIQPWPANGSCEDTSRVAGDGRCTLLRARSQPLEWSNASLLP